MAAVSLRYPRNQLITLYRQNHTADGANMGAHRIYNFVMSLWEPA